MKHTDSIFSFGETIEGINYKVLNEREIRASSGIMLLLGAIALVNGFVLRKFNIIPYISGFLLLNFIIGVFINPKFVPTMILARIFTEGQSPLYIGAVQKRFAWSLGISLSAAIFLLSLRLLSNESYFDSVCLLCIICNALLFFETAFGICIGCKLYFAAIKIGILKEPEEAPNCMGDVCTVHSEKQG